MTSTFEQEVKHGDRFRFGENWQRFLSVLNDERIGEAEKSLKQMLEIEDLHGKSFIDIGSGSGLFSLAARRLGAKVHSFDYDTQSVACTQELKQRYFPDDSNWTIEQGSALDTDYVKSLGQFDIVYSWGVLHHTGAMWKALENASLLVANKGLLFIAIYNDQGGKSKRWLRVKELYCSGIFGKTVVSSLFIPYWILGGLAVDVLKGKNPVTRYSEYKKSRGMSRVHDWFDWLGGLPFEVAKPEEIFNFYHVRRLELKKMTTCGGRLGCNQFVFIQGT
ncbi:Methyltransferase type 12 [Crinalium epipsammum PCC 9333]|uniref:Methyltransferase type 12 n=1 Tax=Crinalium epipsammum PCC 9333 TaxID=1173022 RepID=K9W3I7_9CYAN|nr:class I SAM-dependent methyltransferase [Crinalium epipsammum]AFZ14317.1 Methyltransferase type 12 [Crinalium epipsammum PCC 9333]